MAAIMFKIECAVRLGYTSTTSQLCKWNETFCRKVLAHIDVLSATYHAVFILFQIEPSLVVNIQFQRPKRGRDLVETQTPSRPGKMMKSSPHSTALEEMFLRELQQISPSSAVFSSLAPVSKTMTPAPIIRKLPTPLTALQKHVYTNMSQSELNAACQDVFKSIVISWEECTYLEECTRLQSQSRLWFEQRIGRITASRFSAVAHASLDPPPTHLVKQLMERSPSLSHIPAIQWGVDHEDVARAAYLELANENHINVKFLAAGLHLNPNFPHFGASLDGIICCECCGEGIIEIKCPYKHRDKSPHDVSDPLFYLQRDDNGKLHLKNSHQYYYQVQGQIAVCEKEYCDFVCWTPEGMHVERILPDSAHFAETKPALDYFFIKVLLPLLLSGKSHSPETETLPGISCMSPTTYCWCRGGESGQMVACDNPQCTIEWFHFECVGLTRKPRGKWFCSERCKRVLNL